jgi:hypothetical protein
MLGKHTLSFFCSCHMNMSFQFLLESTPIKQAEAVALLAATGEYGEGPIAIELSKVFDLRRIDSKKLFELSIEKGNPELASLAWKISVQKPDKAIGKIAAPVRNGAHLKISSPDTPDHLIEVLNSYSGYWSAGAALLLSKSADDEWTTLKEIATSYVNSLWRETEASETCVAFRGFWRNERSDVWVPADTKPGAERKNSFHVSPVYIGLREGMLWCRNHGLIEQEKGISVGSLRENVAPKAEHMQRMFYQVRATDKGKEMVKAWGDVDDYVDGIFMRSK